ncbi:MAG TPA: hypothetical protein PL003_00370 [Bacteroidales bacterium]|nr:hypothetical protein [Bacteroidales bacterium]
MRKFYYIFYPDSKGSITEELDECLKKIEASILQDYFLIKLNIFADLPDYNSFLEFRSQIHNSLYTLFGSDIPAFNLTVHPPQRPWKIVLEATCISPGSVRNIIHDEYEGIPYIILETESGKELWSAGVSRYQYCDDTFRDASAAFEVMRGLLEKADMSLNNVVRQWNYIGNILSVNDGLQNYQKFNEVRNDFYSAYRNVSWYPAATGVGMKIGNVILDFSALQTNDSIIPVDNPEQVRAYKYGQDVLKGVAGKAKTKKHPPQFERALLISGKQYSCLHISGTAAIKGQLTVGKDVYEQSLITIKNIQRLTDTAFLNDIAGQQQFSNENFSLLRVYIKYQSDFETVKGICRQIFPDIPAVFIEADICRDDLLMEIEAEVDLNQ